MQNLTLSIIIISTMLFMFRLISKLNINGNDIKITKRVPKKKIKVKKHKYYLYKNEDHTKEHINHAWDKLK